MKLINCKTFIKKTQIYLCKNKVCNLPVSNVRELMKTINDNKNVNLVDKTYSL